jgi:hypothetical protein
MDSYPPPTQPCIRRIDSMHLRIRLLLQARVVRKAIRVPYLHQVPVRLLHLLQRRRRVKVQHGVVPGGQYACLSPRQPWYL